MELVIAAIAWAALVLLLVTVMPLENEDVEWPYEWRCLEPGCTFRARTNEVGARHLAAIEEAHRGAAHR
jgi:hypothetical protein